MELVRLDKLVSKACGVSRQDAKKLICSGKISVCKNIMKNCDEKVPIDSVIEKNGEEAVFVKNYYIMQNKPLGIVSSTDGHDGKTVLDILPDEMMRKGLFPAGRLDKYSHGMMIITDDGEFAHRMLSPVSHVEKEYLVKVDSPIVNNALKEEFLKGIFLGDGKYSSPSVLTIIDEYTAKVVINEGIYHQVRRMFKRFGGEVTDLKRIRIGNLPLDENLKEGDSRFLNEKEILAVSTKK